jgi:hypothetical protein
MAIFHKSTDKQREFCSADAWSLSAIAEASYNAFSGASPCKRLIEGIPIGIAVKHVHLLKSNIRAQPKSSGY